MPGVRNRETQQVGRGDHRSGHTPASHQLVPGDKPSRSRLEESRGKRILASGSGGGGEALRAQKLDRAELQAGKELAGMGPLPGKEGHLHTAPLADGVLGVQFLLEAKTSPGVILEEKAHAPSIENRTTQGGKKERRSSEVSIPLVAAGAEESEGMARTIRNAHALLEGVLGSSPARGAKSAA